MVIRLADGLGEEHQERFDLALDVILTGLAARRVQRV